MRIRSAIVAAIALVVIFPMSTASAEMTCSFSGGSAAEPHLVDPSGDWDGAATGTEGGLWGDVNRESADILGAWFDSPAPKKFQAHVTLGSIADPTRGSDFNLVVYVVFDNPASKLNFKRQFVSASFNGRGTPTWGYGDVGPDPNTGINTFTTRGGTTGTLTQGSPAQLNIDLKWSILGEPQAGSALENIEVEADFIVGTSFAGFLQPIDDTSNGEGCFEAITL